MSASPTDPRRRPRRPPPEKLTPMFRQWVRAKQEVPDALLFFRMGDFYELFFEDAEIAAPILEIALTTRGKGTACEAPMCGVPHHSASGYIARLVEQGQRVAVCEQMEDPKTTKGMVRRGVVRVVSPGTLIDAGRLDPAAANWLAAIAPRRDGDYGVAFVDLSTGGMVLSRAPDDEGLSDLLGRYEAREVLAAHGDAARLAGALPAVGARPPLLTPVDDAAFDGGSARRRVTEALRVRSLSGFGCPDDHPALAAAAAALEHLGRTQRVRPAHLDRLRVDDGACSLQLDASTRRNLELVANLRDGSRRHTLLGVLDRAKSPMGSRAVRDWLLEPLVDTARIRARHGVVEALVARSDVRARLREALGSVRDVERLLARSALGTASPADAAALRRSLQALPAVADGLSQLPGPGAEAIAARVDPLDDLRALLERALLDEPGAAPGDGRVIREGHDAGLDEARDLARGGRTLIAGIEAREREATGISSLKIRFNKVFGYFIEVSKSNLSRVPEQYERRQTIATGERFVTPEIKELEARILGAEERLGSRERALFAELLAEITARATPLRSTAEAIAEIDALAAFGEAAALEGYVRPVVDDDDRIEIEDGRHPVVERLIPAGEFVPNDCRLDAERRILIVTGPNMGGKSTYLRQVALTAVMAQAGSFVPARAATIGVVDRIFCRVGASDNLAGGESTFMVEMTETANILHNATPKSLVILDEIGRGTATFDGMAIAWSVVEHLHDEPRLAPKALFATHYHELTELAGRLPRLANVHIAVREHGHEIVLLHRVEAGPSDRSYGVHVARLAGLPDAVVSRARALLDLLAREGSPASALPTAQLPLFDHPAADVEPAGSLPEPVRALLEELVGIDPDDMTPREAHDRLRELVRRATDARRP